MYRIVELYVVRLVHFYLFIIIISLEVQFDAIYLQRSPYSVKFSSFFSVGQNDETRSTTIVDMT